MRILKIRLVNGSASPPSNQLALLPQTNVFCRVGCLWNTTVLHLAIVTTAAAAVLACLAALAHLAVLACLTASGCAVVIAIVVAMTVVRRIVAPIAVVFVADVTLDACRAAI